MNTAIIKAGGTGERINNAETNLPKQFIEIGGKPIIIYSIEPLQKARNADRIIIACHRDYIDLCWDYVRKFGYQLPYYYLFFPLRSFLLHILFLDISVYKLTRNFLFL